MHRLRARKYRAKDPDRSRKINARCRLKHKDNYNAQKKLYLAANPDLKRVGRQNRRARLKASTVGRITLHQLQALRASQFDVCAYCPTILDGGGHLDHVIPLKQGGLHHIDNLQFLCAPCNLEKTSKTPLEYMQYLTLKQAA
jgi:5-methylcytosine-specific restriction endonuclease McrA